MARSISLHISSPTPPALPATATQVLRDYEHWLLSRYGSVGTYLDHAKSFLKRFKSGGTLLRQLETFASGKSITGRSILKRFARFLEEKKIDSLQIDFSSSPLPRGNIYVKLFLLSQKDRLKSRRTKATYATVLNHYFERIGHLRHLEKVTAEQFIFSSKHSDFTSSLYASVLRSFCGWALSYLDTPDEELSPTEHKIKAGLSVVSKRSLRQIAAIKSTVRKTKGYYKESLSEHERNKMLKAASPSSFDLAVLALMACNGLRPIEVERLSVKDIDLKAQQLKVWGKGRTERSKETIALFLTTRSALRAYLKESRLKKGKLFPDLSYKKIHAIVLHYLDKIKVLQKRGPFSPHSLRHTAGQLLYDSGIPLEYIQRTLRHSTMASTLIYTEKAIERSYFKRMKSVR